MVHATWLVLCAAALPMSAPLAQGLLDVPLEVGGSADVDACPSVGVVGGLDPRGDNFLAVRSGPAVRFAKVDELHAGEQVLLCAENGGWLGIVYAKDGVECGLNMPQPRRAPYTGPCRAGWVAKRYVRVIAG
jgi:hypothetical protein